MKQILTLFLVWVWIGLSCKKASLIPPPEDPGDILKNTFFLPDTVLRQMEGIYTLIDGIGDLGTNFVCKVSKSRVSFFSNKSGIYIILQCGFDPKDSLIKFAGFWRQSEGTAQGLINMKVEAKEGGSDLLTKGLASRLLLKGNFFGNSQSPQLIGLKFEKGFSQYAIDHEFMIFAHHGVQTTANPPFTENSLNGAIHDQGYGVNGLEFDVHLTRDHVPICAHDASINIRVTEKGPLSGEYIQYNFAFLEANVRLTDGEKIPSVEQILNAVIDSTTLKYMWLDIKGDPDIFKWLEPVVRKANERAGKANRKLEIITDLTSDEVLSEFKSCPTYRSLPVMSEMSLENGIDNHCQYWAPRFSLGLLLNEINIAHGLGIKVLSWTLNDKDLILDYMQNGKFDGFISDYPAYIVYDFYTLF